MDKSKIIEKFGDNYEVTPDTFHMGIHQEFGRSAAARFMPTDTVLDTCVGGGFTTIQLAKVVKNIIAVDINPAHLELARKNIEKAGLSNVTFILGDITHRDIQKQIGKIDGAFLDPDWAKIGDSKEVHVTTLKEMVPDGELLFNLIYKLTPNIIYRLPKEIDKAKLPDLPPFEIEENIQNGKLKFYTYYFGKLKKD